MRSFGRAVTTRLAAMGIRDHPIAPRSLWQNGHAERLIGSIRWECLDHIVVFGDAHLRRIYTAYYTRFRTHLSLAKDSPGHRPIQRYGQLAARPILGGIYPEYCRKWFSAGTTGRRAPRISPQDSAINANPDQGVPVARRYKACPERAEPSARATGQGGFRCMVPIVCIRR
jgi:hypothetical protein